MRLFVRIFRQVWWSCLHKWHIGGRFRYRPTWECSLAIWSQTLLQKLYCSFHGHLAQCQRGLKSDPRHPVSGIVCYSFQVQIVFLKKLDWISRRPGQRCLKLDSDGPIWEAACIACVAVSAVGGGSSWRDRLWSHRGQTCRLLVNKTTFTGHAQRDLTAPHSSELTTFCLETPVSLCSIPSALTKTDFWAKDKRLFDHPYQFYFDWSYTYLTSLYKSYISQRFTGANLPLTVNLSYFGMN